MFVVLSHGLAPAATSSNDPKVAAAIRRDLGPELKLTALEAERTAAGVYRVNLTSDLTGYPEASRRQIRGLVRKLVIQSLAGMGYELDPNSRLQFRGGPTEVAEVRGERPLTVVLFMPETQQPRTLRLSPAAVHALRKEDLSVAGSELAAALGVSDQTTEILVNTRQVYLRWRGLQRATPKGDETDGAMVVYARWWGEPPAALPPPRTVVEVVDPFKPWWASVQFWQSEMDARLSSGATIAGTARAVSKRAISPELQVGAGDFWFTFQNLSHQATAVEAFDFAGVPGGFPAGTAVSFDMPRLQLAGKRQVYSHGEDRLDAVAGMDLFYPELRLDAPLLVGRLQGFATGPIVGVQGSKRLSRHLDVGGALKFALAYFGQSEVGGVEFETGLAYTFPGGFEGHPAQLSLGWRLQDFEVRKGEGNDPGQRAGAIDPSYSGIFLDLRTLW